MIRLAIRCQSPQLPRLVPALRGVAVAPIASGSDPHQVAEWDALAVLEGPVRCDTELLPVLAAGKHLLVPAGEWLDRSDLSILRAASNRSGAQLSVVNPDRFRPSRQLIHERLSAGKLGIPGLIRMHHWESAQDGSPLPAGRLPGPILRAVEWIVGTMGRLPQRVYALSIPPPDGGSPHGCSIQVHLGFADGAMALFDYTNRLPPGDDYGSVSVIGSAGSAYADDHQNGQVVFRGGHPQFLKVGDGGFLPWAILQDFVDGLEMGRDFSASVTAWEGVLSVADAVSTSLSTRRATELGG